MLNYKQQLETGLNALTGLLDEFRQGNIVKARLERDGLKRHLKELSEKWDQRFQGFPRQNFTSTSIRGQCFRGKKDAHLKNIIVELVTGNKDSNKLIVNPICVLGRHAQNLALRLPEYKIIATDIDPRWNSLYSHLPGVCNPANYEFIEDNIFEPQLKAAPTAVVFFGACGSLTDAAMDYAIDSNSHYLICRTCCHENIGGNTQIIKRFTPINSFFRTKNRIFLRYRRKEKYAGFYFSDRYTQQQYPRSKAAQNVIDSNEFLKVSRNSTDSDICRAIIDLDRFLFLVENGYNAWYRSELFVAEKQINNTRPL